MKEIILLKEGEIALKGHKKSQTSSQASGKIHIHTFTVNDIL